MKEDTPIVIFGNSSFASAAWYCVTHDSPYHAVAFTVDQAYLKASEHEGLPVVPFEHLEDYYPPDKVKLLIPLGFRNINGLRRDRYNTARNRGYDFVSYVASSATVWPDMQIGENCLIFENVVIQPFTRIGNNVIIYSGVNIGHHGVIGSHSFIAAGATFGGNVTVSEQVFVGLGASIRDGINLAEQSFIGAGSVIVSDTEVCSAYIGNPAHKINRTALEVSGG
jgi:sugar O-acyltransferase (sialic acid O-acetyltransferase NeuD family)